MRDTRYATEKATADIGGCRIERIFVKEQEQDEIRFSWWKDGAMMMRPLDLPEEQLLPLIVLAIRKGVFTEDFMQGLQAAIYETRRGAAYADQSSQRKASRRSDW